MFFDTDVIFRSWEAVKKRYEIIRNGEIEKIFIWRNTMEGLNFKDWYDCNRPWKSGNIAKNRFIRNYLGNRASVIKKNTKKLVLEYICLAKYVEVGFLWSEKKDRWVVWINQSHWSFRENDEWYFIIWILTPSREQTFFLLKIHWNTKRVSNCSVRFNKNFVWIYLFDHEYGYIDEC